MLKPKALLWIFLAVSILVFSSPSLVNSLPTVGAVPTTDDSQSDVRNPQNWVGKKFVVLEMPKSLQHYGYTELRIHKERYADPKNPDLEDEVGSLLYDKFAGDILTVTDIKAEPSVPATLPTDYDVVFYDEKRGIAVYAETFNGRIKNLAPVEELVLVKKSWMGNTIWSKSRTLEQYDAQKGIASLVTIPLGKHLTVVDVVWGTDTQNPVWVIVKGDGGETGFYEIAGLPTNKDNVVRRSEDTILRRSDGTLIRDHIDYWDTKFYDHDPRKDYPWPQAIWNKVCNGEISIGMTESQVRLALDLPDHINRDTYAGGATEQWIYEDRYVYFAGGKVKVIQDR